MKITAHCIVKNEDSWVWFAINSVLPYVDEVLVCVNGFSDNTLKIIKSIHSSKIKITEKGSLSPREVVDVRREQIEKTNADWILILDGDEIWPEEQLQKLLNRARAVSNDKIALFNRTRNCIGDIFHYLRDESGNYEIGGIKGNLNLRMIRKTADLDIVGEYPLEAYIDKNGPIAKQDKRLEFVDCWYLHTSFLTRSSKDVNKTSGSLGRNKIPEKGNKMLEPELPEILFVRKPEFVPNPFFKRGFLYEILAEVITPLKMLKDKING